MSEILGETVLVGDSIKSLGHGLMGCNAFELRRCWGQIPEEKRPTGLMLFNGVCAIKSKCDLKSSHFHNKEELQNKKKNKEAEKRINLLLKQLGYNLYTNFE